jgi:5'-3' exonuclease
MYWRGYSIAQQTAVEVEGQQMATGGVFKTIQMIQRIEANYLLENGRIYFLFDNPSSGEDSRKGIDPDYKINRKKWEPRFYRGLDYLQLVLRNYQNGYRIIQRHETEADDMVLPILKSFEGHERSVLMISNDMDWGRAIENKIHWMVHKNGKDIIYDRDLFYEYYGFYPGYDEICLYKALRGDESDGIVAGVKDIPENVVLTIIHQAKSVQNMFSGLNEIQIDRQWKTAIQQNKGRIKINLMLVEYQPLTMADVREYTVISEFNKSMLLMYYRILGFTSYQIDPRFRVEATPLKDENFFNSFDLYPRAE